MTAQSNQRNSQTHSEPVRYGMQGRHSMYSGMATAFSTPFSPRISDTAKRCAVMSAAANMLFQARDMIASEPDMQQPEKAYTPSVCGSAPAVS